MSQYGTPTRFFSGLSTAKAPSIFNLYPRLNPVQLQFEEEDFIHYNAADWALTAATGSAVLQAGAGGKLLLSTTAAANDLVALQNQAAVWAVQNGGLMLFDANVQFSDVATEVYQFGYADTFATLAPTQGIYFEKPTGSAIINGVIKGPGGTTTVPIGTVAAGTPYSFGFVYDGRGSPTITFYSTIGLPAPYAYSNPYWQGGYGVAAASNDTINYPNGPTFSQPTSNLVMGVAVKATAVAIRTLLVDYLVGGCEIPTRF